MTPEEAADLDKANFKVFRFVADAIRKANLPPEDEVKTWPLGISEWGDIYCADSDCPLRVEDSIIAEYEGYTFTLEELYEAIADHIARRKLKEE